MITPVKSKLLFLLLVFFFHFATAQTISINELMADNDTLTQITDEVGQYDDWIELYNNTNADIDLSGYFLSDKLNALDKWQIPTGTIISANGYKIFWADDDATQGPLHTNFKLKKSGESVYLSNPDLVIVDSVNFGQQNTNISYARIPNGTGEFIFKAPTFGFNNELSSSAGQSLPQGVAFELFPNPTDAFFRLRWTVPTLDKTLRISIIDALGKQLFTEQIKSAAPKTTHLIPFELKAAGLYFVHLETADYRWVEILVVE